MKPSYILFAIGAGLVGSVLAAGQVPPPVAPPPPAAGQAGPVADPSDPAKADAQALASAGLKADDPAGLMNYLRQRTLSDTDLTRIQAVIRRMGDEQFEERVKASAEVEKFGPAAIAPLRTASQSDADPEVAYRAGETLRRMETVSHSAVAQAVVRGLARAKPPGAAQVLLGYLPVADTVAVEDEIRDALVGLALRDGKADPVLVAALKDQHAIRRGAAAVALIEGAGKPGARIADAYPQIKAAVTAEADPETRFRMVYSLLTAARDESAVGDLIGLIPSVQRGRIWQIEDYLVQLAGKSPPKIKIGTGQEALEKARDQWRKWWDGAAATTKLEKFEYVPKTTGRLLLVSMSVQGYGSAKVAELGPDLKERWSLRKLSAPVDCQVLSDGRVVTLEQNNLLLRVWDPLRPEPLLIRNLQGPPVGFQPLPDGKMMVAYRHMIAEYDKDWKQSTTFARNQSDILAAHRLPNGQTLVLCQNPWSILRLDDKGKLQPNPVRIGQPFYQPRMQVLSDDRVLITEQNRVVEYDLGSVDKREVWRFIVNAPSSVQRLPNGNTLIVEFSNNNAVKEVTPEGEVVWTHTPTDGMRVMRAERR